MTEVNYEAPDLLWCLPDIDFLLEYEIEAVSNRPDCWGVATVCSESLSGDTFQTASTSSLTLSFCMG